MYVLVRKVCLLFGSGGIVDGRKERRKNNNIITRMADFREIKFQTKSNTLINAPFGSFSD